MNMDDILRNIYGPEEDAAAAASGGAGGAAAEPSPAPPEDTARRTAQEVWKEISALAPAPPPAAGTSAAEMTLEDFLARDTGARAAGVEGNMALGFPDGDGVGSMAWGGGGRSRKRAPTDRTDRVAMQRQKRMIKNRESAARSRDRKQAYVSELESQVTQLEEEQSELLKEQVPAFMEREHEFRFLAVVPEGLDGVPFTNPAVVCAHYSVEEYFQERCQEIHLVAIKSDLSTSSCCCWSS